jgi:hypothetical protein
MAARQSGFGPRKDSHPLVRNAGEARRVASRAGDRKNKRERECAPSAEPYGVAVPDGLHDAIEAERGNLAKAESVLGCMAISMEAEADLTTGPYYPDVAEVARDLIRKSINGLDSLTLQQYLLRNKIKEDTELRLLGFLGSRDANAGEYARLSPAA